MKLITQNIDDYLASNKYINWKEPEIIAKALELTDYCNDEIENIRNIYLFVRDEIKHSWDVQDSRITIKATEVLKEKVGICWAKANLFAALLRAINIPVGICYQRLTFGNTPDTGYCIHALNAVYVKFLSKWIRIDARGNKEGIYEEFSL